MLTLQVILNFKLHSTTGQSTRSVAIALTGKMTDFVATYSLVLPLQYVIMTYFSSSVAYVNGIQVAWYFRRSRTGNGSENEAVQYSIVSTEGGDSPTDGESYDETHDRLNIMQNNSSQFGPFRMFLISLMVTVLILFAYCLTWATKSFISLVAPVSIIFITFSAMFIYNRDHFCSMIRRCCHNN